MPPSQEPRTVGSRQAAVQGIPVFQIRDVADHLGITWKAAETAVLELAAARIITSRTAGRRNRVFEAADLFTLTEHFERTAETPPPA